MSSYQSRLSAIKTLILQIDCPPAMPQEPEHFSAPVTSASRSRRITAYKHDVATTQTQLISPEIMFEWGQHFELDVVPAPPGVPCRTTPDAKCNNRATPTSQQSYVARRQSRDWRSSHPSFGSTLLPHKRKCAATGFRPQRQLRRASTLAVAPGQIQCSQHARGLLTRQCYKWLPLSPLLCISGE